jgi:hypothetical protein
MERMALGAAYLDNEVLLLRLGVSIYYVSSFSFAQQYTINT